MPAAETMEENFDRLLEQCEAQELEAPGGVATPQVYAQMLALYLLNNDMNNARYLWKRIPQNIKSVSHGDVWWTCMKSGFYWTGPIGSVLQRAYSLVAQAYTSITAEDFAAFVGYSVEEAVKGVVSQGWQADPATRMVMPKKPGRWQHRAEIPPAPKHGVTKAQIIYRHIKLS
uniref:COP9 signalosome subunit 8 n=1 Tax=Cyprinodon variegatus TaxID=28743 RepID=A0A3Q2CMZ4_CYPVA